MTKEELDELLRKVCVFNGYSRTKSFLSDAQRDMIILALLPEVNRRIEQPTRMDEGQRALLFELWTRGAPFPELAATVDVFVGRGS